MKRGSSKLNTLERKPPYEGPSSPKDVEDTIKTTAENKNPNFLQDLNSVLSVRKKEKL